MPPLNKKLLLSWMKSAESSNPMMLGLVELVSSKWNKLSLMYLTKQQLLISVPPKIEKLRNNLLRVNLWMIRIEKEDRHLVP